MKWQLMQLATGQSGQTFQEWAVKETAAKMDCLHSLCTAVLQEGRAMDQCVTFEVLQWFQIQS